MDPFHYLLLDGAAFAVEGASVDIDFPNGRGTVGGNPQALSSIISTSRASAGDLAQRADGSWASFAANTPRITDQGLLVEESRTNLFLNSAAAVTQSPTVAIGSVVVTVWGASGSVTTAAGTATGTGFGAIAASVTGTRQVLSISGNGTVSCTVTGSPLYVQVEAGAFGTSPIITAGASATRAADVISLTGSAATLALSAKAARTDTNLVQGINSVANLLNFNGTQALQYSSTTVSRATNGTNNADATIGASGTVAILVKSAFDFDATSITAIANGGTAAVSANAWGSPSGTVYVANRAAGDRALNGYMRRLILGPTKGQFDGQTL